MAGLWSWVVSKIITRIFVFGCIVAAIVIFSRMVDQAYEMSPWFIKVLIAFLISALIFGSEADGKKRKRIVALEAELAKRNGRASGS